MARECSGYYGEMLQVSLAWSAREVAQLHGFALGGLLCLVPALANSFCHSKVRARRLGALGD